MELDLEPIDYDTYLKVILDYFLSIIDLVVDKLMPYTLPCNLGQLCVYKMKSLLTKTIDWKLSKECGHYVYHKNLHTNGYVYKTYWSKPSRERFYEWHLYRLQPSRHEFQYKVRDLLMNRKDYEEITSVDTKHKWLQNLNRLKQ